MHNFVLKSLASLKKKNKKVNLKRKKKASHSNTRLIHGAYFEQNYNTY